MAYDEIDPFGERRADWRLGLQTSHLVGALVGKAGETFRAIDFMPDLDDGPVVEREPETNDGGWEKPRTSPDVMYARIDAAIMAAARKAEAVKLQEQTTTEE